MCIFRAEKEYAALTKQLQRDLEDKREIIKRLSSELDNHAREFADLKGELNKVDYAASIIETRIILEVSLLFFGISNKYFSVFL